VKTSIFESTPRWPGAPPICAAANLPSFTTAKEAVDFNEGNGHPPILKSWRCRACCGWHYYSGAHGDTNGGTLAGSRTIPPHIKKLFQP
jgi:hypothetical protein